MKRLVFLFFLLAGSLISNAQEGRSANGYRGYVDLAVGDAYNFNTDQIISTDNMQWYSMISTTHGYVLKNWYVGAGVGYYHSYCDKENMYPIYATGRYSFENPRIKPYIEVRAGIMYDPYWIEKMQKYGALSAGVCVYKGLQVGLRGAVFSRPSRYLTANAAVVIGYTFGK